MTNLMPLVHQARRTIRNRQDGNPFAKGKVIAELIEALGTAYLAAPNERVSRAIKVELDQLESRVAPASPPPGAPGGARGSRRAMMLFANGDHR